MNGYLELTNFEDENLLELLSEDEWEEWETGSSRLTTGQTLNFSPHRITVSPRLVLEGFCFNQPWLNENHLMQLKSFVKELVDLARRGSVSIRLVGHTDNVGSQKFNHDLGLRRAKRVGEKLRALTAKVFNRLQRSGVKLGRVEIVEQSEGEKKPVGSNGTEAGRARNRRVQIFVSQSPQS